MVFQIDIFADQYYTSADLASLCAAQCSGMRSVVVTRKVLPRNAFTTGGSVFFFLPFMLVQKSTFVRVRLHERGCGEYGRKVFS